MCVSESPAVVMEIIFTPLVSLTLSQRRVDIRNALKGILLLQLHVHHVGVGVEKQQSVNVAASVLLTFPRWNNLNLCHLLFHELICVIDLYYNVILSQF